MKMDQLFSRTPTKGSVHSYIDDEFELEQRMPPVQNNVISERYAHLTEWPRMTEAAQDEDLRSYIDDRTDIFTETSLSPPVKNQDQVSTQTTSEPEETENYPIADVLYTLKSLRSLDRRLRSLEVEGNLPYLLVPPPRPPSFLIHTGCGPPIVVDGTEGPTAPPPSIPSVSAPSVATDAGVVGQSDSDSSAIKPQCDAVGSFPQLLTVADEKLMETTDPERLVATGRDPSFKVSNYRAAYVESASSTSTNW